MKKGDVVLFRNQGGWISNTISKVTKSEYVHVGIIFDTNKDTVAIAEAKSKGFVLGIYNKKDLKDKSKYKILVPKHKLKHVDKITTLYIGTGYDYAQLIKIWVLRYLKIKLPGDGVKDLICSEAVARVLYGCNQKMDLPKEFKTSFDYVTPAMINKSRLFNEE